MDPKNLKATKPRKKKNHRGAKMKYKTKKTYLRSGNIEYNKSYCQPSHTQSNDETLSQTLRRMKVLRVKVRYESTNVHMRLKLTFHNNIKVQEGRIYQFNLINKMIIV